MISSTSYLRKLLDTKLAKTPLLDILADAPMHFSPKPATGAGITRQEYAPEPFSHKVFRNTAVYVISEVPATNTPNSKVTIPISRNHIARLAVGDVLIVEGVDSFSEDGQSIRPGWPLAIKIESLNSDSITAEVFFGKDQVYCPKIPAGTVLTLAPKYLNYTGFDYADNFSKKSFECITVDPYPVTATMPKKPLEYVSTEGAHQVPVNSMDLQDIENRQKIIDFLIDLEIGLYYTSQYTKPVRSVKPTSLLAQCQKDLVMSPRITNNILDKILRAFFCYGYTAKRAVILAGAGLTQRLFYSIMKDGFWNPVVSATQSGCQMITVKTAFGNVDIMHDPAIDILGLGESGIMIDPEEIALFYNQSDNDDYFRISMSAVLTNAHSMFIQGEIEKGRDEKMQLFVHEGENPKIIAGEIILLDYDAAPKLIGGDAKINVVQVINTINSEGDETLGYKGYGLHSYLSDANYWS